jgi:hypothetical protein
VGEGDLQLDGILADREGAQLSQGLGCLETLLVAGERLANGAGLLGPQVQRLVLLVLVQLAQVLLLLLMHHNVDAGDGLADHTDLGELRGGTSGDLKYNFCSGGKNYT